MEEEQWSDWHAKSVAMFLNGDALELGRRGEEHRDDSFLLLFNAHHGPVQFTLPGTEFGEAWTTTIDTASDVVDEDGATVKAGDDVEVSGRSIVVLKRVE
jgi:glycogen operon protein